MIELDHVSLTISRPDPQPDLEIIRDVSAAVNDNETVVLVGPSGCGKTTLLRGIGGLVELEGRLTVDGEQVQGPTPRCAMVFQEFNLFPWRTISANVAFGLEHLKLQPDEIRDRVRHFIELVHLQGFEDSYPHQLSGGMKQRAGLARALATGAPHLLMDEPFGALDPQVRQLMQESLLDIGHNERRTIMFVTHDVDEAIILGDRILVLTNRPCRIDEVVDVPFDDDRKVDDIRVTPEFALLRKAIWERLRAQIQDAPTAA